MKRTLKIASIIALVIAIALTCIACTSNNTSAENNEEELVSLSNDTAELIEIADEVNEEDTTVNFPNLPDISSDEAAIAAYCEEVLHRQAIEGNFMTEEEISFFKESGYYIRNIEEGYISFYYEMYNEVEEFYFPVLYKNQWNEVYFFYTTETGDLRYKNLERDISSEWCGNVHTDKNVIAESVSWAMTYDEVSGEIQVWSFGEVQSTYTVPAGSVYAGFSEFEGYIFRSNTDVYSLNEVGIFWVNGAEPGVEVIAHNVAKVIDADYYLASDPWCQPLFLMTDGSIKAYVGWEGNQEDPDSETHLVDIYYEGGFDR